MFEQVSAARRVHHRHLPGAGPIVTLLLAILVIAASHVAAEPVRVGHVEADLVSEVRSIQPGQPFWVGLEINLDEHWHVYWRNPGDAGLPPKLTWDLPEGFIAEPIQWPYPKKFVVPPLTSFGYSDKVLFPVRITPPVDLAEGEPVTLRTHAEWLVCAEACIPGETELSLTLPVSQLAPEFDSQRADQFNAAREKLPVEATEWVFGAAVDDSLIQIWIRPPEWFADSLRGVYFFPHDKAIIHNAAEQTLEVTGSGYSLVVPRFQNATSDPERITGVLYAESGWRGPGSEKAITIDIPVGEGGQIAAAVTDEAAGGIWKAILFAFLGGIILNLMPCVLPVLSLKILGFVNKAGEGGKGVVSHGLVFTLGVLLSFWALAGALLILRAGGEQLGWGFQLQSPVFLVILSSFIFLFGLSLLGVFEIGTSLTAVGGKTQSSTGWGGSFLNGVTATVVATPCTAPFMGSALGFSLAQPAWVAMTIFTALGLGMAAPYVVLSASPKLLKFLPKPGRWMETFKQIMGFLLLATVVWLAWVLGIQAGVNALAALLIALLLIGIGGWIFGRWGTIAMPMPKRGLAYVLSALLLIGGVAFGLAGVSLYGAAPTQASSSSSGEGITWEPYTPERYEEALASGEPVFIDFTAAWCLSCQVNERVAFRSAQVRDTFAKKGIVALKADWTSRDDTITQALARYGRNSVPLYVLYDGSGGHEPVVLPEIITPGIVMEALANLEG